MKKRAIVLMLVLSILIIFFIKNISMINSFNADNYGNITVGIGTPGGVIIDFPKNDVYNFSLSENFTIQLNVSSDAVNLSSWRYSLIKTFHNQMIYNNVYFSPNTTINAVRGDNLLIVYANDTLGNIFSSSVNFQVEVPNSSPFIHSLPDEIFSCENQELSFIFNTSDIDEDILSYDIYPKYPQNPFYIDFYDYINFSSFNYIIYTGIINKSDVGGINNRSKTYSENLTVADLNYSDQKQINITLIEVNNAPVIGNIGTRTVWSRGANRTFYYQVSVDDIEDGTENSSNFLFNVSFSNETLFNISNIGIINFTANSSHIGVHNITICIRDNGLLNPSENINLCEQNGSPIFSCVNFSMVITNENRQPIFTDYDPNDLNLSANGSDSIYFYITKYDPDGPPIDSYFYIDDVLKQYKEYNGKNFDIFPYYFGCGISGEHRAKIVITDGELNNTLEWNISVGLVNCPSGTSSSSSSSSSSSTSSSSNIIGICKELWGCGEWSNCINLKKDFEKNQTDKETFDKLEKKCYLMDYIDYSCGYQTRSCKPLVHCNNTKFVSPEVVRACQYSDNPNCFDGIKNCHDKGCEIFIDCGGPCASCPSCSDNIKNGEEEGIDCGASCSPCKIEKPYDFKKDIKEVLLISLITILIIITLVIIFVVIRIKNLFNLRNYFMKNE